MAPKYKLTYFNVTALGEPLRFLLSYGGLEFEDVRVSHGAEWTALKPSMPMGQVPTLEVDGKELYQSVAIARYLGNVIGITGATPLENWEIDAIVDSIVDLRVKLVVLRREKDPIKKEAVKTNLREETIPFYLSKLEESTKKNGGYLAIGKLTWGDIYFIGLEEFINTISLTEFEKPFLAGYPALEALKQKIRNLPSIKAWIEKRPVTEF